MSPINRPPTKDEYEAILKEIRSDSLEDAITLMEEIPAYQEKIPLFQRRLSDFVNDEIDGEISTSDLAILRNKIAKSLLIFIQNHNPQEAYASPEPSTSQASAQAHTITNPDASLLWVSRYFLGRDGKATEISGVLNRPEGRGVIVTGMAGNGKTTICHHVLRQWLQDVPDRIVYLTQVEFITTVAGLARALGSFCNLKPEIATPDNVLAKLTDLPTGILYLDNLESVLEDSEAHQFLERLQSCTNLTLLASSRRNVAGFTRVRLDVLEELDAIELFQLIWQQQTGERIGDQESPLLQDFVANDLGCHPISIEVTASHAETVGTLHQLVEEFRDSKTTYFTRYASDEEGRLDNLFQSLGLSLNRLQDRPNALRLLALCAVYESGLSGPMQKLLLKAEIFTPSDRSVLMERNLVQYKGGFLSVLPPMVRFIRSILTTEDGLFDKNRLFQDGEIIAKADDIPVPNRLEFLDFYANNGTYDLEPVVWTFSNLDFLRNLFFARPILERLTQNAHLQSPEKRNVLGDIMKNLGELDFRKGNNEEARKHNQMAEILYRKTGSDQGRANILTNLGEIDFREGNNEEARKHNQMAEILYRKTGDEQGRANILTNLGEIDFLEGNIEEARKHSQQAENLYRKTGNDLGRANILTNLGRIDFLEGYNEEARKRYQQAENLYRKTGDEQGRANILTNLGEIDFLEGYNEEARKRYQQAENLYRKTGDEQGRASILINLGRIDFREGYNEEARKRYQQAYELYRKTGNDQALANIHHYLAQIATAEADNPAAKASWTTALSLYRDVSANRDVADTLLYLADLNIKLGGTTSELEELLTEAAALIKQYKLSQLEEKLAPVQSHLKNQP